MFIDIYKCTDYSKSETQIELTGPRIDHEMNFVLKLLFCKTGFSEIFKNITDTKIINFNDVINFELSDEEINVNPSSFLEDYCEMFITGKVTNVEITNHSKLSSSKDFLYNNEVILKQNQSHDENFRRPNESDVIKDDLFKSKRYTRIVFGDDKILFIEKKYNSLQELQLEVK